MSLVAAAIDDALYRLGYGAAVDLAVACDVSPSTVSSWRTGSRLPRPRRWTAIETFLLLPPGTIALKLALESV